MITNPPEFKPSLCVNETSFPPPEFPPKAGKAVYLFQVSKLAIQNVFTTLLSFSLLIGFFGLIIYFGICDYEYDDNYSNRKILLEDSLFLLVDENGTEIDPADLLPGDLITFTHIGNITEAIHSSTTCTSSSSGSYYGESVRESYYGGDDDMECWTNYYTHYVLNASSFMFESSTVNDIYMCHRSTCKVTGELIDSDDFWIDIRTVEVIS